MDKFKGKVSWIKFVINSVSEFFVKPTSYHHNFFVDELIILLHYLYALRGNSKFARPRLSYINNFIFMMQQLTSNVPV